MEEPDICPGIISQEGCQRPLRKFLNRYVRNSVGLRWHDLGVELLDCDDHVEELDIIEAEYSSNLTKCCTKMFNLWLQKQPSASWNQLIVALRQPDIELDTLATKIKRMLLQPKPKPKEPHRPPIAMEPQFELVSLTNLKADFTSLLMTIIHILSSCPNQQANLQRCKDYCLLNLKVSDGSNDSLFSAEKIDKIKECGDFKQLIEIVGEYTSWDEHSILKHIALECKSDESKQEIQKFDKKLGMYEGLKMIADEASNQNFSEDFMKLCVIINKPYKEVTIEEYKNVKAYISSNLRINPSGFSRFIIMLYHSLHIEWLVTIQAIPHMIKNAHQNKDVFIKENFVYMRIGNEVVINDEDTLTRLLSKKQLEKLKINHRKKSTEISEEASACKQVSSDQKIHTMDYYKPNTVADEFSYVAEQITVLLQSHDPKLLVKQCDTIMASDHDNGITFFSDEQLKQLHSYKNTPLLLQELSYLWSWSNHSMLRVLVGFCGKAIQLLDDFDCHLDPFESISAYPLFEMIPPDASSRATLIVKFAMYTSQFTLQDAFNMCSLVVNQCGVTRYCPQLIATQHVQGFITVYWSIPKCVVGIISSKILQYSSNLYDKGVLEVAIYPDIKITTGNIAYPSDTPIKMQELLKQLQHVRRMYERVFNENKKLKQDETNLFASLQTQAEKYKELQKLYNKVQEDANKGESIKERLKNYQSEFRELKLELDKAVKAFNIDPEVDSTKRIVVATAEVEMMQEPEYEIKNMQKLLEQVQHHATEAKIKSMQQQSIIDDLTTRLDIKEKDIARLNRLLTKSKFELKQEQGDGKVIKDTYPIQYQLLGSGNYGKVQKVNYKDKLYAGKVFKFEFLPGYPNVSMDKLVPQFTLKFSFVSKFSHPNVEQFVKIVNADNEGVPMIITELLNENLTDYITCNSETFHYNQQLSVCNDMAQGLQYLHSQQLIHGNLHGANVLMTHDHHAKIADYLCPLLLPVVPLDSSSPYLPPETIQNKRTSVLSNVFTLSVLFLQVITKLYPQPSSYMDLSELKRRKNDLENVHESHPLLVLIQQCLSNREVERPLMKAIIDHVTRMLKNKDSAQMMAFKLIHTSEYPPFVSSLAGEACQLKHVACRNLPVPMYWAYAVTIGMMVYVTGGNSRNGDAVEHIYRYDIEKDKWDKLPPSQYHHCVPVVLEEKLSLIGGRVPRNKAVISKVSTYDEDTMQWITVYPDMNQPRYRPAVVTTDSHVIVLGGRIKKERSKLTDTIEILNIKDKQWTTLATVLPSKMYDMSATVSYNLIWIVGYDDGDDRSNKIFTTPLDPLISLIKVKHSWKLIRNDTVCFKTAIISNSDPPVILGGDDRQQKPVTAVAVFDPKTESWGEVAMLSSPRIHSAVAKLPEERGILVIGGCTEANELSQCNSSCLNTTEIYYCCNFD